VTAPNATSPAVELRGVTLHRGDVHVLEDIDLRIERGAFLAVLGPNGSGKTTLLRVLLGLIMPQSGSVRVLGTTPRAARGRVGYVPQRARFDLDFPIRAEEVVRMGRLARGRFGRRYDASDREAARRALDTMEVAHLADRPIGALSGGELQRVLIARALAIEPELMLLDEPTASLDERIGRSVWDILEELSHRMTLVVVSHDIGAISQHVRGVACLNQRLYMHPQGELTDEILEATYGCPVDLLAHGHPHRVLPPHGGSEA
jgi:zinc transport system ATP-binding protein